MRPAPQVLLHALVDAATTLAPAPAPVLAPVALRMAAAKALALARAIARGPAIVSVAAIATAEAARIPKPIQTCILICIRIGEGGGHAARLACVDARLVIRVG